MPLSPRPRALTYGPCPCLALFKIFRLSCRVWAHGPCPCCHDPCFTVCVDLGEKHKTKTLISSSSVVINIHRSLPRRISLSTAGPCSLMPPPLPAVPLYKPCTTTGHAPVHYLRIPAYLLRPLPYGPCPCPLSPPMPLLARPTVHYLRIPAPPPSLRAMPLSVHVSLSALMPPPLISASYFA